MEDLREQGRDSSWEAWLGGPGATGEAALKEQRLPSLGTGLLPGTVGANSGR